MKKCLSLLLALMLLLPAFAAAYEPVSFTQVQALGNFSLQIPEGWTVQPNAKNADLTDFFDTNIKKKDFGIIETVLTLSDEPLFQTIDGANTLLLARVEKEKIKDYQLVTVAGCPAIRWTNTQTLATVKKTYVHGLYILEQNSSLDVLFSTRAKDQDLQAAEFEKLLATLTAGNPPVVPLSTLPQILEVVMSELSFEETQAALVTLLGVPLTLAKGSFKIIDGVQYPIQMLISDKQISVLGEIHLARYLQHEKDGSTVKEFAAPPPAYEKLTFAQGAERLLALADLMKQDFGDVIKAASYTLDENWNQTEQFSIDHEPGAEELIALLKAHEGEGMTVELYFGDTQKRLRMYNSTAPGTETESGELCYEFSFELNLSNVASE